MIGAVTPIPLLALVLLVADMLQPVNSLTVKPFLNGNVRHGCSWRGTVPMFLTRREPDNIPWPNLFNRSAQALDPATALCHNQRLAQRMRVPGGPRSWLEGHAGTSRTSWIGSLEKRVNANCTSEILGWSFT